MVVGKPPICRLGFSGHLLIRRDELVMGEVSILFSGIDIFLSILWFFGLLNFFCIMLLSITTPNISVFSFSFLHLHFVDVRFFTNQKNK